MSIIEWAFYGQLAALEHIGVDQSGFDILVAKKFLNGVHVACRRHFEADG